LDKIISHLIGDRKRETIMKKLFFIGLLFISSLTAMESPNQEEEAITITIYEPEQSKIGNFMQILALDGKIQVGYITFYQNENPNSWNLIALRVNQAYRKNYIAKKLMQECINYIKSQGAKLLIWKAHSLDSTLSLHTLITIYRRLIESMGYTMDSLTLGTRKGSGLAQQVKMRLEL
jgi:GNAT superfamily N-acetyltransferase